MKTTKANYGVGKGQLRAGIIWLLLIALLGFSAAAQINTVPLVDAVRKGDTNEIKKLLEDKADPNAVDANGRTPLMITVIGGRKELVQLLLEGGADPDRKDKDGSTATQLAIKLGHAEIANAIQQSQLARDPQLALFDAVNRGDLENAKLALAKGANVNAKDTSQRTPLIIAATKDNVNLVAFLLDRGATVNAIGSDNKSAYDIAQLRGSREIKGLLQSKGAADMAQSLNGELYSAAEKGDADMVLALLNKGADPNHHGYLSQNTLSVAAMKGHVEVVEALLSKGANPNMTLLPSPHDNQASRWAASRTPLFYAIEGDNLKVAELLLAKGANVNAVLADGTTPLMAAAGRRNGTSLVPCLLSHGANVNAKSKSGSTALVEAVSAFRGRIETTRALLDAGADISKNAVEAGAQAGRADALSEMLKRPCSQDWKNGALISAVIFAARNGQLDAAKALLDSGADPNMKDSQGVSSITFAASTGNDELVKLLAQYGAKDRPKGYENPSADATAPPDSKTMTRAEWKKMIAPYDATSSSFNRQLLSEATFKKKCGIPARTQKVGDKAYWYYACSDGTIQLVIEAPFLESQGVVISSVNEYGDGEKGHEPVK